MPEPLARGRVAREMLGGPLQVGGRTLWPVARVTGLYLGGTGDGGGGGAAWLRALPVAVVVREPDGQRYTLPLAGGGLARFGRRPSAEREEAWQAAASEAGAVPAEGLGRERTGGEHVDNVMEQVSAPLERVLEQLNVKSVFGEPTVQGDTTIIPVASISARFGYGFGANNQPTAEQPAGGGGGAGVAAKARPVGYLSLRPEGVTYEPMIDTVRMGLAGMMLSGWALFWITRTIRAGLRRRND